MADPAPIRAAVLTVSTSRAAGARSPDKSGDALAALLTGAGAELVARELVADDEAAIREKLRDLADGGGCDLVLTTGGTGMAPDDLTPEATRDAIEREAPGIAEALRAESARHSAQAMLSRGVAGIRGRTLIVNLPGSARACEECFAVLAPVLEHAVALLRGEPAGH